MASLDTAQQNYKTNVSNIPWNAQLAKNFKDSNTVNNATINANLPIFNNLVEQQARNFDGAASRRITARTKTDEALNLLKNIPLGLDTRISQIDIGGIQNKIKAVDEQIAAEKAKQSKSNELLEIRKEQSAALEKKYSANLHSSWLGLFRPLKDNTHVGLNVASVAFGILALISIAWLSYSYATAPVNATAAATAGGVLNAVRNASYEARNMFSNLTGGFRKVKSSHK